MIVRRKEMKSLIMYIALPVVLILTCIYFIVFGEDVYRYPCMDPANWQTEECQPPACEAMGLCTKYLIDIPESVYSEAATPTLEFSSDLTVTSETPNE